MKFPFHSLRWRLQAWHGLILLVVLTAFCVTAYRLIWDGVQRRIDRSLFDLEHAFMGGTLRAQQPSGSSTTGGHAGRSPPMPPEEVLERFRTGALTVPRETAARFEGTEPGHAYYLVVDNQGKVVLHSGNEPAQAAAQPLAAADIRGETQTVGSARQNVRNMGDTVRIIVGRDIQPELDEMHRFVLSLVATGLGVWLLGLIGGWWLAGRAIKPVRTIGQTASRIAAGNLEERISTEGTDSELDQLSRVLNETFDRLHAMVRQQKQFTADASHELRTPVTVVLAETRRILKRERSADEYRDVIRTCETAGERMQRLIESLLLLAHQENPGTVTPRESEACDLAAFAQASVEQVRPLATERTIDLQLTLSPAECRGDPAALSILVNNLVANAIQHHGGSGHVWVESGRSGSNVFFQVRDDGPGIAPEHLPHIFERFYRADASRSSGSGHAGLGLAIVKQIADNHHASVTVDSAPGRGTTFRVTLAAA